ncbi:MAG: hypothetical protein K2Q03_05700 [Sphingobacteriaceae bacterium]|nr:hypothetical protein [Sphingobacteriaceae bacterium]
MKEFFYSLLSEDKDSLSSKRFIAFLFAMVACGVFIWLEAKANNDTMKESLFNSVLLFISALVGVTTLGNLFNQKKEGGKNENNA